MPRAGRRAGAISYDVYAGVDSSALAMRAVLPIVLRKQPFFVPDRRWPDGVPFFPDGTMLTSSTEMHVISTLGAFAGSPDAPILVLHVYRPLPPPSPPARP